MFFNELNHWGPWTDVQRLFEQALQPEFGLATAEYPALDVYRNDESILVRAELPGVDPSEIELAVLGKTLTIEGKRENPELGEDAKALRQERFDGRFRRELTLPYRVESEQVSADFKHGILEIILPRAEADKPRRISVNSS